VVCACRATARPHGASLSRDVRTSSAPKRRIWDGYILYRLEFTASCDKRDCYENKIIDRKKTGRSTDTSQTLHRSNTLVSPVSHRQSNSRYLKLGRHGQRTLGGRKKNTEARLQVSNRQTPVL
jgi:hypothetical protein